MTSEHWVVLCHPAWGHVRHINGFLTRMLRRRRADDVRVSYLLHNTHASKATMELRQLLLEEGEAEVEAERLSRKVRFVGLAPPALLLQKPEYQRLLLGSTSSIRHGMEVDASFQEVWDEVFASEAPGRLLTCATTGQTYAYDGWPKPKVFHVDIYGGPNICHVKDQVRTVYHWSSEFISFWRLFMSDDFSQGSIEADVEAQLGTGQGEDFVEACFQRYNHCENRLLAIPGLRHGMYDYEVNPGQVGWPKIYVPALTNLKRAVSQADAIVVASSSVLQPIPLPLIADFLQKTYGNKLYATGPAIEDNLLAQTLIEALPPVLSVPVLDYLDECLTRFGSKSVALLSWGTIWAPFRYPAILEAWLDEAIATERPFVLNRSAELFSKLSPWIEERLRQAQEKGLVFQASWIPQRSVLRHPALGVFVSHCGYSSACESTVPIIAWPSFFDQGIIAQQIVDRDTGWQLYQVRGPDATHQKCRQLELAGKCIEGTVDAVRQEARQILIEAAPDHDVYKRKAAKLDALRARLLETMQPTGEAGAAFDELVGVSQSPHRQRGKSTELHL